MKHWTRLDLSSFRKKALKGLAGYYTINEIGIFMENCKADQYTRTSPLTLSEHIKDMTYFNTFINRPAIEKGPNIQIEVADKETADNIINFMQ